MIASLSAIVAKIDPIGTITPFGGAVAPDNWLFCRGQLLSRTTYSALFAVIGVSFGAGDGSTTFAIPNFQSRVAVGTAPAWPLGHMAGEQTHTITVNEMPSHNHGVSDPGHSHGYYGPTTECQYPGGGTDAGKTLLSTNPSQTGIQVLANGGGAAMNLMQPFVATNYIIKVQ